MACTHTRIPALVCGLLAGSGCIIDQKLGETATEGGSESAEGGTDDPTAGTGTGGSSQSNTSTPGSDGSESDTDTAESSSASASASDSDGGSDGSTGEPPVQCEQDAELIQWLPGGFDEPIAGVSASFGAVLAGDCTLIGWGSGDGGAPQTFDAFLELSCTLDGRVDAQELVGEPFELHFDFVSTGIDPSALAIAAADDVQIRLVEDHWGMGWDAWFVIERPDGTLLLDVVQASYASPTEPNLSVTDAVLEMLDGEPWHGDLGAGIVDTDCDVFEDKCGGVQRAVELGWQGVPQLVLQAGQTGGIDPNAESAVVRASVWDALDYSGEAVCTDHPLGVYGMAAWLEEP